MSTRLGLIALSALCAVSLFTTRCSSPAGTQTDHERSTVRPPLAPPPPLEDAAVRAMVEWLPKHSVVPPCRAACDSNGDGATGGFADAIFVVHLLFGWGPAPVAPFPVCGPAGLSTDADLGCEEGCS